MWHHVAPKCHPKNSIQIQTKHVVQPCLHTLRVQMCGPSRIDSCEHRNWQPGEPMRTIWQNLNFGSVTNWENDSCSITLPSLHFEGLHEGSGMPSARSSEWAAAWPIAHVFGTCLHWTSVFFMFFSGQVSCAWQSPCAKKIWEESLQPSQVKLKACDAVG